MKSLIQRKIENIESKISENDIVILSFKKSKKTTYITLLFIEELYKIIEEIAESNSIKGLIFYGFDKDFHVERELSELSDEKVLIKAEIIHQSFNDLCKLLKTIEKPTLYYIDRVCSSLALGLALACTWRVASRKNDFKFYCSEIDLGLIPEGLLCYQLVMTTGVSTAVDLLLNLNMEDASSLLAKKIIDRYLEEGDLSPLEKVLLERKNKKSKLSSILKKEIGKKIPFYRLLIERIKQKKIIKKQYLINPAYYKIIDLIFLSLHQNKINISNAEKESFATLLRSRYTQNILYIKQIEDQAQIEKRSLPSEYKQIFGIINITENSYNLVLRSLDKKIRLHLVDQQKKIVYKKIQEKSKDIAKDKKTPFLNYSVTNFINNFKNCAFVFYFIDINKSFDEELLAFIEAENKIKTSLILFCYTSIIPNEKYLSKLVNSERIYFIYYHEINNQSIVELKSPSERVDLFRTEARDVLQFLGYKNIIHTKVNFFISSYLISDFITSVLYLSSDNIDVSQIKTALSNFGFNNSPLYLISSNKEYCIQLLKWRINLSPNFDCYQFALDYLNKLSLNNLENNVLYNNEKEILSGDKTILSHIVERCVLAIVNSALHCSNLLFERRKKEIDLIATSVLDFPLSWGGPLKYVEHIGVKNTEENLKHLNSEIGDLYQLL